MDVTLSLRRLIQPEIANHRSVPMSDENNRNNDAHEKPHHHVDHVEPTEELSDEDLIDVNGGTPGTSSDSTNLVFTSVSNVLKTRHDTAKNSISN
jgi:hypothetical protein